MHPHSTSTVKQALLKIRQLQARIGELEAVGSQPVAIVGVGMRLPGGVDDMATLAALLAAGRNTAQEIPRDRWDVDDYYDPEPGKPGHMYTRRASFVGGVDQFDAAFFNISGREAAEMDPQQRLLLETSWEAFERAGIDPLALGGTKTGVFVGVMNQDYAELVTGPGTSASVMSGRIAYLLGVHGPTLTVDTACSSSLVALHLACRSLANGECDLALVGSANLQITPTMTVAECAGAMLSRDGRCKTFDAAADGFGRSDGCISLVLKPLDRARRDGDPILGVIRGSAVNHGGASGGLLVPSGRAQTMVIRSALADAGLGPNEVDYIEAHGTGTALGDPIELQALDDVYGQDRTRPLIVGSVKSNFGHLEAAAGLAGVVKVLVALAAARIPPHLGCKTLNPRFDWAGSAIAVPVDGADWPAAERPRRAGVSAFGVSGTNAHVLIEEPRSAPLEATEPAASDAQPRARIVKLAARDPGALEQMAMRYAADLADPGADPAAFTAGANTRSEWPLRRAVVARSGAALAAGLRGEVHPTTFATQVRDAHDRPAVVFLYPGQGAQYPGMARSLYLTEPVFRSAIDSCADRLADHDVALCALLWGDRTSELVETRFTQPCVLAVEYALTQLWRSWGIEPDAVIGHSVGEYAAAVTAGMIAIDDALSLIAARGRLLWENCAPGGMIATVMAPDLLDPHGIDPRLDFAAFNAPQRTVIAGPDDALATLTAKLDELGLSGQPLKVSHAFHSAMMAPAMEPFRAVCEQIAFAPPNIPVFANVTGERADPAMMTNADYWVRHLREPVRFTQSIQRAAATIAPNAWIEMGPGTALASLARLAMPGDEAGWLATMRPGCDEHELCLRAAADLYTRGAELDWRRLSPGDRGDVPTYPFQRQRYWVDHPHVGGTKGSAAPLPDDSDWVHAIEWHPIAEPTPPQEPTACLLVVERGADVSSLVRALEVEGADCTLAHDDDDDAVAHAAAWLDELPRDGSALLIQCCAANDGATIDLDPSQRLVALAQLAATHGQCGLALLTRDVLALEAGEDAARDEADGPRILTGSLAAGCLRNIRLELPPSVRVLHVDTAVDTAMPAVARDVLGSDESIVLHRQGQRWTERLVPAARLAAGPSIRRDAAYLVVGGTGAIGLSSAEALIKRGARHVVLAARSGLSTLETDETGTARLAAMRRRGAIVDGVALDARDPEMVMALVGRFGQDLPALAGVVFAAGEADRCSLAEIDADRFGRIAGDRIAALWNVHSALATIPLDFLVVAASLAGIWGAAGSVHYGAANAVADRLARWRDARGLPTIAFDWGPWSGGGVAEDVVDQLRRHGLNPLNASHAARLSLDLIGSNAQLIVADVEWDRFIALMGIGGLPSLLREIARDPPDADVRGHDTALRQTLAVLSPAQRRHALAHHIEATVRHVLRIADRVEIRHDAPFQSLGMDSLTAIEITQALQRLLDLPLPATTAFDHGRIDVLARKLGDDIVPSTAMGAVAASATTPLERHAPIAVIGMACRFPGGVDGPDALWDLLEEGRVAIDDRPVRWDVDTLIGSPVEAKAAGLSLSLGALDDIRGFDAAFFGIAPREALTMDPQQRLTLETAWLALEHAGATPSDDAACRTGTYVGVGTNEYGGLLADDPAFEADAAHLPTGNATSVIAGRVAFALGLTGPAMAIDTACSSALVALLQATNDLRRGVCDRALAGGVNVAVTPDPFLMLSRAGMISPSGRCRTFDADADGYVRGEGCGMVVLKRLADAERDGDAVIGVIHGGAVNQDGRTASLTAPSGPAQNAVIRAALADAGIGADQVGYVETHGTGTPLGDPIEIRALDAVYGQYRGAAGPVRVGSIKTNIGHLEAAAGIAGLCKALLARRHARVPRHVGFDNPNPAIEFDDERIIVAAKAADWPVDAPYAAVSAFGFSGTNAHVVIGPAPSRPTAAAAADDLRLITISARDDEGLRTMAADLADMLSHDDARLIDVSLTTLAGRSCQPVRAAIWGKSRSEIADRLRRVADAVDATLSDTGLVAGRHQPQMPPTLDLDDVDETKLHVLARTLSADSATFRNMVGGDVASVEDASVHALAIAVGRFLAALGIELGAVSAGPSMRAASRSLADTLEIEQRDRPAAGTPVLSLATLTDGVDAWLAALAGLFVGGEAMRPALLLDGTDAVKASLPPTRFRRRQFWPTSALRLGRRRSGEAVDEADSAFPGERVSSPFDDGVQYLLQLRAESPAHLTDHRIFGEVLVAGATHVSAVLEAARREQHGAGSVTITNVTFQQSLSPGEERYVLRTAFGAPDSDGVRRAQTASRPAHDEDAAWTTHLDARVGATPNGPAPVPSDPETARAVWPAALPAEELYERMRALGYHLGPSFRLLGDGWRRDNVVLRAISLPETLPGRGDPLLFYPGLIDSCLHAIGECLEGRNDQVDADEIYVPYALSRVTVHRRPSAGERLWVEATLRSEAGPGGVPIGDVLLFDATGAIVAELAGFDSRKTTRGALSASRTVATLLHQLEWEVIDDPVGSDDAMPSRRWIVLATDHPVAASAVARLRAEGRLACMVDLADAEADDVQRLAAALDAHPDAAMLCCWPLAEGTATDRCDRVRVAMTAASGHARPVVVVTIAGQAAVSEDRPDPVQAAVAAMVQAIALEGHAMTPRVIDLAGTASTWTRSDEAAASSGRGDVILARRENRTLARRLDHAPRTVAAGRVPVLAADRTYVVVGGTGALGRLLIGWLATRGARHIALIARTAGELDDADRVGLVPDGVTLIAIGADASDRDSLHAAFATIRTTMPPVAGMIHAAGRVEDGLLPRQSARGIAKVLAAKADIGANLLTSEAAAAADFVLFLTSIAGVTGVPGQSNYAAANGYLDALAVVKQADGMAVGALALGPVAGGGMAREAARKGGFAALDPGELLAAVDRHVYAISARLAPPTTLLARVNWTEFATALPAVAPLLIRLSSEEGLAVPIVDLARLRAIDGEDGVRGWAGDFMRTLVSQTMLQPIETIETDVPLNALGLDSLMAIDLRRRVASASALDLPMEVLLSGATLDSLVLLMGDLALRGAHPDPDLVQEYLETEL